MIRETLGTTTAQRKMALAVAKDVLKHIEDWNLSTSIYFKAADGLEILGQSIKKISFKKLKDCKVCARGAMFISRAKLFNVYKLDECVNDEVSPNTANDFGRKNADLIECAFQIAARWDDFSSLAFQARDFGHEFPGHRDRLQAIMEEVVKNRGVFLPDVAMERLEARRKKEAKAQAQA